MKPELRRDQIIFKFIQVGGRETHVMWFCRLLFHNNNIFIIYFTLQYNYKIKSTKIHVDAF